jgi:hypothetical protein
VSSLADEESSGISWEYGEGRVGVLRVAELRASGRCLAIGWSFPWWGLVAGRLGLTLSKLILFKPSLLRLSRDYFSDVNVRVADDFEDIDECELLGVRVLCMERPPLGKRVLRELLEKGEQLECVVFAGGKGMTGRVVPKGWVLDEVAVKHSAVGGVTNAAGKFVVLRRVKLGRQRPREALKISARPARDAREVLKMARPGIKTSGPVSLPFKAVTDTNFVASGVMCCAGAIPFPKNRRSFRHFAPSVRTKYGGRIWVKRKFEPKELLAAADVPEKLVHLSSSHCELNEMVDALDCPVKMLQAVAEAIGLSLGAVGSGTRPGDRKRKAVEGALEDVESMTKKISLRTVIHNVDDEAGLVEEAFQPDPGPPLMNSVGVKECEEKEDVHLAKAVKNDNSAVRVKDWNFFLALGLPEVVRSRNWKEAAETIRPVAMRWWRRSQLRKCLAFKRYKTIVGEFTECDRGAMADAITRVTATTWWAWNKGSRPFYWAWDEDRQIPMRDGINLWIWEKMIPSWIRPQDPPKDPETIKKVVDKLMSARERGYISMGEVKSLIFFFDVPKGLDDIRMVYDGTKSGLNAALWAPWFPLPTVDSLLRSVVPGTFMSDNDVGEMFLNFVLHSSIQERCGVDLTKFFPGEVDTEDNVRRDMKVRWERWTRCAMGLRTSPYQAVQGMLWAMERVFGDRDAEANVFAWKHMRLNLPGDDDYDPTLPWVFKSKRDGSMAPDVHVYVDDIRCSGRTELECWRASQRVSSVLASLGLQDAARKRRPPSQKAGAWAGSIVHTSDGEVVVLAPQDKWEKLRRQVAWLESEHDKVGRGSSKGIPYDELEKVRGFMVHMVRSYPGMNPYLKGIHLTLCSWLPGRDKDGWKIAKKVSKGRKRSHDGVEKELEEFDAMDEFVDLLEDDMSWYEPKLMSKEMKEILKATRAHPKLVKPVPRLGADIEALKCLTEFEFAPRRRVRMTKRLRAMYGFGDASGTGFGSTIRKANGEIVWKSGVWSRTMVEEHNSNFFEFSNLVHALEDMHVAGELAGHEIFMFTDNTTAEAAHYHGTTKNGKMLFNLALRLRKIEMDGDCRIYLIHVAGKRMIWQGSDGLSRGDENAGVMSGEEMMSFVPLHLRAVDRSDELLNWVWSWCGDKEGRRKVSLLQAEDWASPHKDGGVFVWSPPPAAAETALEWLGQSIHKRPDNTHVVLIPRLMTSWWRKKLLKTCDVAFTIPIGSSIWATANHEPLICAVCYPLSRVADGPWKFSDSTLGKRLQRKLPKMFAGGVRDAGNLLRECLVKARSLSAL